MNVGLEVVQRYADGLLDASLWPWLFALTIALTAVTLAPARQEHSRLRLLCAGLLAVAAVAAAYKLLWLGDDAFISFRYARNLASGEGLVYNPGERVEGYTNFFWTVLLAAGIRLGAAPIVLSVVLSLSAYGALVVMVTRLVGLLSHGKAPPVVSAAAVATASSYVMWSFGTSGLETMFAAALVVGMVLLAERRKWGLAGVLGILAAMSHPDHILYYGSLGLALLLDPSAMCSPKVWFRNPERRRPLIAFTLPLLVLFVPYYLGRWAYYGDFFPNTYYAKSANLTYFEQGGKYLFISLAATGTLLALPASVVGSIRRWSHVSARYALVSLLVMPVYIAKVGGDFMLGRLVVTILPMVFVFAECATRDWLSSGSALAKATGAVSMMGLVLTGVRVPVVRAGEKFHHVSDEGTFYRLKELSADGLHEGYTSRAKDLREFIVGRGVDPLMGIGNVGVVGYLAPVRIRDLLALTDPDVARMPITRRGRPGHEKIARGPFMLLKDVDLSDDPIFPAPYANVGVLRAGRTSYFMAGYKPSLVGPLTGAPNVSLPNIQNYIDRLSVKSDPHRLACDLWFINEFYFRYQPDSARRSALLNRIAAAHPKLATVAPLFFPHSETGFRAERLYTFEAGEEWEREGSAFEAFPSEELMPDQGFVFGHAGTFANSWSPSEGDKAVGRLRSPSFQISGSAITVEVGGGNAIASVYVALVVDGEEVGKATGCEAEVLGRRVWDVAAYRGKQARIEIVDQSQAGWGHVLVDSVQQWTVP